MIENGAEVIERAREQAREKEKRAQQTPEAVKRVDDEKTKEMLARFEKRLESSKSEGENKPPEALFVLRKMENWSELGTGWTEERKEAVGDRLTQLFHLDRESRENALEIMAANKLTPDQILSQLTPENYRKISKRLDPEDEGRIPEREKRRLLLSGFPIEENGELQVVGLGLDEDYVKRFILTRDYHAELKQEATNGLPENTYELAWQIAYNQKEKFGIHGEFPVLQMQIEEGKDGREVGKYRINQANFIRWVRHWIMHQYDMSPDDVPNYFNEVKIPEKHQYSQVTLGTMVSNMSTYFRDEDGHDYSELGDQALLEGWMMQKVREYDIKYKYAMGSEEQLSKAINELFFLNDLTKNVYQKSMLYYMSTLGLDFNGKETDTALGAAWSTMFLAYYNLSDFEKLQEVLGKDSSFFKREGLEAAMKKVLKKKFDQTGLTASGMNEFLGRETMDNFEKAFTKDGKPVNEIADSKAFAKFINIFGFKTGNENFIKVVKEALLNTVQETHSFYSKESSKDEKGEDRLDDSSLELAHLIALSWQRFSGAGARNDVEVAGYDAATKWFYTELYRRKMATEQRGGSFGNPYTVPMFKGTMVDFVRGVRVSEAEVKDDPLHRKKTPYDVFEDMHTANGRLRKLQGELTQIPEDQVEQRAQKQAEIDQEAKAAEVAFKQAAGQLEFPENTMRNYATDHVDRAQKIYDLIMKAGEVNFEKFTKHDPFRGVTFDRATFQAEVQDKFLKPLRYLWETSGQMNFNMPVRFPVFVGRGADGKDIKEYKTLPLGEALFGYEMLNIPEFRKSASKVSKETMEENGWKKKKSWIVDADGRYVIDYDKVQKDKTKVWKQWAMMKFAGDLWTHIDIHSTDPGYGIHYYYTVLHALESIPGEVFGSDEDMTKVKVVKPFFSHHQMKWLRKISNTTDIRLFFKGVLDDLFRKSSEPGLGASMSLFLAAIFKGY